MIKVPHTAINFVTLWVCRREDGTYVDRGGFVFPARPVTDEVFEIDGRNYAFSWYERQQKEDDGYEFWHFIDQSF
jgi:hypothetical protein